ncbi:MAG: peptidase S8, partial [Anaerolineaceae bacterium]|nr:peptidase S8 [Anaerolineaceae bacterium]
QEVTFTDPFDGTYAIDLYEDVVYAVEVSAVLNGYQTVTETGLTFAAPTAVRDYALLVGDYCEAPGYWVANGLYEPYDAPSLPTGWSIVDHAGEGVIWRFDDPAKRSNRTGGEGGFAAVDSSFAGLKHVDSSLISPSIDFSGQGLVVLAFDQDFAIYPLSTAEIADVDVSIDGGAWENVLHQEEDAIGPNHQTVDISAWAGWQSDVRIRFHYYNAYFDWWWQVDNIRLGPYDCGLEPGGVVAGFVTDFDSGTSIDQATISSPDGSTLSEPTPDDSALADGFYWLFQPLATSPQTVTVTAEIDAHIPVTEDVTLSLGEVVRQDFVLKSYRSFFPLLTK